MSSLHPTRADSVRRTRAGLRRRRRGAAFASHFLALAASIGLGACARFSPDGGSGVAAAVAKQEFGVEATPLRSPEDFAMAGQRVSQLLKRPLSANGAVEIALRSNRGLQAAYNRLGIAEAAMVRESLPPNPTLSLGRIAGGLSSEVEGAIATDILALATLPARAEIASDRFEAAQLEGAEATLRTGVEARRAYFRAVAAHEQLLVLEQAATAAETAAKIAAQLGETGAMNTLDLTREKLFHAEIAAHVASARQRAVAERERLARAMGLSGRDLNFALPSALPAPPTRLRETPQLEREAIERRIELQVARKQLAALEKSLGLTQSTRFLDLIELSSLGKITRENVNGESVRFVEGGAGATIEIPIFDLGETRLRESEQRWLEAVNLLAEKVVNVRSQAREAYGTYRAAHEIARRRQHEIMPLHAVVSEESLRRYNAMIVDVFALLEEERRRLLAAGEAVEAKRDYWLAEADLRAAIVGGGGGRTGDERPASFSLAATGTEQP